MYETPDEQSHIDGDADGMGCIRGLITVIVIMGVFGIACFGTAYYLGIL